MPSTMFVGYYEPDRQSFHGMHRCRLCQRRIERNERHRVLHCFWRGQELLRRVHTRCHIALLAQPEPSTKGSHQ